MNGKKNKAKLPVGAYLIILIAAAVVISGVTLSKYIMAASSQSEARIATPVIDIAADNTGSTELAFRLPDMTPVRTGDTGEEEKNEVGFYILNFNGELINETAIDYSFSVDTSQNIPLIFSFYKVDSEGNETAVASSENIRLGFGEKKSAEYKMYVEWDKTVTGYNQSSYADEIDYVTLTVNWQQAD